MWTTSITMGLYQGSASISSRKFPHFNDYVAKYFLTITTVIYKHKHFQYKNDKINTKNPIQIIPNNLLCYWPETILQQQLHKLTIHVVFIRPQTKLRTFADSAWLSTVQVSENCVYYCLVKPTCIIPNNFQSVVDSCPVQKRHIFCVWLVHITSTVNEFHAPFQHAILSSTDNVKSLVVIWQLLLLLLCWWRCSRWRCWRLQWIWFKVFMLQTVWKADIKLHNEQHQQTSHSTTILPGRLASNRFIKAIVYCHTALWNTRLASNRFIKAIVYCHTAQLSSHILKLTSLIHVNCFLLVK